MNFRAFIVTIRWKNVLIIGIMQSVLLFHYVLPYCGWTDNSLVSGMMIVVATGMVLAAGNIYNDILDVSADAIHPSKPSLVGHQVSIEVARKWTLIINVISVLIPLIGWIWLDWDMILLLIFILTVPILVLYSHVLKSTVLIGNMIIATLCALAIWMTVLTIPGCNLEISLLTKDKTSLIFTGYIFNAFLLTLLREILKDKEDAAYDIQMNIRTIGSISEKSLKWVVNWLFGIIMVVNVIWFSSLWKVLSANFWVLGLIVILTPMASIILIYNLFKSNKVYRLLSGLIKLYFICAVILLILWR